MPVIDEKHVVLIAKSWGQHQIAIDVTTEGISFKVSLDDFLQEIVKDINPAGILTRAKLLDSLRKAAEKSRFAIQDESARVM